MKRIVVGMLAIAIAAVVLAAGLVAATHEFGAMSHQSMYSDDDANSTKQVSGESSETDAHSRVTAGCLFFVLACIIAIAMYRTREKDRSF